MKATPVTPCGYPITQSSDEWPTEFTCSAETNQDQAGSAAAETRREDVGKVEATGALSATTASKVTRPFHAFGSVAQLYDEQA
jgi:hypothetical protein